MAYVNFQRAFVRFKVVYYGPPLCGKTTNLEYVHSQAKDEVELVSLETEGDRTIFFDYMPLSLGKIGGIDTMFKLYTVPGQVRYNRTRQMVLKDVDGVVFVADSQRDALPHNVTSMHNLRDNLAKDDVDLDKIPFLIQYNKRDLPDVLPIEDLQHALNPGGRPWIEACALRGHNVKETLTSIAGLVFQQTAERYGFGKRRAPVEAEGAAAAEAAPDRGAKPRETEREASPPPPVAAAIGSATESHGGDGQAALPRSRPPASQDPKTVPPAAGQPLLIGANAITEIRAAVDEVEEHLLREIAGLREIVQHVANRRPDRGIVNDIKAAVWDAHDKLSTIGNETQAALAHLAKVIGRLEKRIDKLEERLLEELPREIERQLPALLVEAARKAGQGGDGPKKGR